MDKKADTMNGKLIPISDDLYVSLSAHQTLDGTMSAETALSVLRSKDDAPLRVGVRVRPTDDYLMQFPERTCDTGTIVNQKTAGMWAVRWDRRRGTYEELNESYLMATGEAQDWEYIVVHSDGIAFDHPGGLTEIEAIARHVSIIWSGMPGEFGAIPSRVDMSGGVGRLSKLQRRAWKKSQECGARIERRSLS